MLAVLALTVAESLLGNRHLSVDKRGGMKPLDRLSEYLGAVERRLRLLALDARSAP
jgi:hypothetical protein